MFVGLSWGNKMASDLYLFSLRIVFVIRKKMQEQTERYFLSEKIYIFFKFFTTY